MKVGDVVILKSGGPKMTVVIDVGDENFLCSWFKESGDLTCCKFHSGTLRKVIEYHE